MDISGLANATTAATALGNLILVSPQKTIGYQPQKFPTFVKDSSTPDEAFLFHYEGEQAVSLSSDITDHYVENNGAVNDHISLKPETVSTRGFIGELNNVPPKALAPLKIVANKLVAIGAYTPQLSVTAIQAYNEAAFLYNVGAGLASSAVSAWDTINGTGGQSVINGQGLASQKNQTKQQIAFQKMYGYWRSRTLFTVQTPWAVFQDMAIQNMHAVQDAETNTISTFEVTFKIMRFATTVTADNLPDPKASQGRAASHASHEVDLGSNILAPSNNTFLP